MKPVWVLFLSLSALVTVHTNDDSCSHTSRYQQRNIKCPSFTIKVTHEQLTMECNAVPNFELMWQQRVVNTFFFREINYTNCPLPVGNYSFAKFRHEEGLLKLFLFNNAKFSEQASLDPRLFYGLNNLQTLVIDNFTSIPLDNPQLFKHVPNITNLEFRRTHLRTGPALHLLPKLFHLVVKDSGMTTLAPGLLSNLPNLRFLELHRNKIEQIEPIDNAPMLIYVNITSNELNILQESVFDRLPRLIELSISSNKLTKLSSGLLKHNTKLEYFDANNQRGVGLELEDGLFGNLTKLKVVTLSNCKIYTLPEGLFTGAIKLSVIDLSRNKLRSLPTNIFRNLYELKELYIDNNELVDMLPDQFNDVLQLRILNLSQNNLSVMTGSLLKSQKYLKQLHLDYNQLDRIDVDAFKNQTQHLKILNLTHNCLELQENSSWIPFSKLDYVTVLDLSHNRIVNVFRNFNHFMPRLQHLDLSHNLITYVSSIEISRQLPKIQTLNLESNKITHLDYNVSHSDHQTRLPSNILLADNPLNCDCMSYPLVSFLRELSAAVKKIPMQDLRCARPPILQGYNLQDVRPEDLICEIDYTSGFCPVKCYCYKRAIDRGVFVNCSALNHTSIPMIPDPSTIDADFIELHLEQNMLNILPNTGDGWNSIRQLYLANNRLTLLTRDSLPVQLEMLDVSNNQLTEIDEDFLDSMNQTALRNISLSANPWKCHCNNPLLEFAIDHSALITDFSILQCYDGQPITSATLNDLCSRTGLLALNISVAISLVITIALLGVWMYTRYSLEIKVWLFTHNCLQWLVAEEQLDMDKRYDAFISYSHKDEDFITKELLPRLESEELNFAICWHVRDFMPGNMISSQITKAVEESRRTIIVLSPHYLESVWGQMEFNTAYLQSLKDKRNRVIPIIYQDIGSVENLDSELQAYLKTNTYVRWDDPWFWDKLHYAMPHKRRPNGGRRNSIEMTSLSKPKQLQVIPGDKMVLNNQ